MNDTSQEAFRWDLMVEKVINDRRQFMRNHLFLGNHFISGMPLIVPQSMFERHGIIYGPPGSGKTVIAAQIATQLLACGNNVIVIDDKGSIALLNNLLSEAARAVNEQTGKPLHEAKVFNPFGSFSSHVYNPFCQKVWLQETAHERTETLLDAFGIRDEEGAQDAFFAAMAFLIATEINTWFPHLRSAEEMLSLLNDRHLYAAKGGNPTDWNHSRHLASGLRQLATCGSLNASPAQPENCIELTDIFQGERPVLYYFFLSAIQNHRTSAMIGRAVLQQLKKAAFSTRLQNKGRKTFIICDEAQELFGPMFGNVLEQLREFNCSLLMFHQSRAQLVTKASDFRERFENAIGVQICMGARTPDEIAYLQNTDSDRTNYELSWRQPVLESGNTAFLHPRYSVPEREGPAVFNVRESIGPRLDKALILKVSAHPQAGFIRGFLNEKLWAANGRWCPFTWFHHLRPDEYRRFCNSYPEPLPGQQLRWENEASLSQPSQTILDGISTSVETKGLLEAIDKLSAEHKQPPAGKSPNRGKNKKRRENKQ